MIQPSRSRAWVLLASASLVASACTGRAVPPRNSSSGPGRSPGLRLSITRASFGLPAPLQREVAAAVGGVIYVAGGLDGSEHSVSGVYAVDPANGTTTALGNVPQAFHDAAGGVIENHLIVFGGGANETSSDAVQAFDLSGHMGTVVSHLPLGLSDVSSARVQNSIYLVGGYDGAAPQSNIYMTVDATHFRVAGRLPVGLRYAAVAADGTDLVIAGGVSSSGPVRSVYVFDTTTGRVSKLGDLPAAVGHAAAFTLGSIVYLAGGLDAAGNAVRSVTAIDVAARSITPLRPLRSAVSDAAVASDGTAAWLLGGWRGTAVTEVLRATITG